MAAPNLKNFYLPMTRHPVCSARDWGVMAGTDYYLNFNPADDIMAAGSATDPREAFNLEVAGWTTTSMVNTAGSGADFGGGVFTKATVTGKRTQPLGGTYGDAGTPNHALTNASGDILLSPAIFGDAVHMEQAAVLAGKSILPRFLIADFWAAFTVASANEVTSAIGFFEDGATASVEADQYAVIYSDGTNFRLAGNAASMVTGLVVDNVWRKWKIVLEFNGATGPLCTWYAGGALQGTTQGTGAQDEFPLKFGLHSLTTNRQGLGAVRIFYDW